MIFLLTAGAFTGSRAVLTLLGPGLLRIDGSGLPNEVSAMLPRAGTYYVLVSALPGRARFEGDYCVTLESSQDPWQTFTQGW